MLLKIATFLCTRSSRVSPGFCPAPAVMMISAASPVRDAALAHPRLVAYVTRMMDIYYPDFEWDAGIIDTKQAA